LPSASILLLPLDDCLCSLQGTIPHLTRSSLHRCLKRHGISRLPDVEGDQPAKKKFNTYPIGFFHTDIAEVQTWQGKLCLYVGIDRTSKLPWRNLSTRPTRRRHVRFSVLWWQPFLTSARGQRLTAESDFDSRLPFGASFGRTDRTDG